MKKLNVRSKQVVAMVLFFIMTMTAIQLPSFAAIDSLGGNIIPTPQANVAAGEVETGTQVTLTCSNPEAVIYYTEDGSEPSAVSTKYSAPITIYQDTTIKAVSIVNGEKSQTFEAAYSVKIPEAVYTPPANKEAVATVDLTDKTDHFEMVLTPSVQDSVAAGQIVDYVASFQMKNGVKPHDLGLSEEGSEVWPDFAIQNVKYVFTLPEGMEVTTLPHDADVYSYHQATRELTLNFDDFTNNNLDKALSLSFSAKMPDKQTAPGEYQITGKLYQGEKELSPLDTITFEVTASTNWEYVAVADNIQCEVTNPDQSVFHGQASQALKYQFKSTDKANGNLNTKVFYTKFSIQTGTGLEFVSGMPGSELVDLAFASNLSPDDQDITYTVSKKGSGKLEVELTVKSKSGQNVTQVDATVIPKNINVSGLSDNNSSPITVAFDSVKVTPSVPDDASEIDITEQFAGSNLKMAIVRKNNPDQGPYVESAVQDGDLYFSVTQLTSYHQVTPGQQVNYKLFYKSNISERKVLKNMKVRIYVPADQNITVKVGDYQYLTTKVESTPIPVEGGKDDAGNKSFQYIDVTIPEIYSDGLDSVGREMTFGLLWPEGATSSRGETPIRVEVLQKDLSPDSEEYHDVTDISKVTSTNIPKIETKFDWKPATLYTSNTGTNNTIVVPNGNFNTYDAGEKGGFGLRLDNNLYSDANSIHPDKIELNVTLKVPEGLLNITDDQYLENVNNYKGYFNVNGRTDYYSLNDSNSYFRTETTIEQISQVDGRTDSVRLKITITPTSSYGKISYLQIHYLYPNLFDVGTMAAGSEIKNVEWKLESAKLYGRDSDQTVFEIDPNDVHRDIIFKKENLDAGSALKVSKSVDKTLVTNEDTLTFKISNWGCEIGNNKIYEYNVYDDWETEAGSKNPNQRMELQGIQYPAMSSGDIYVTPYYRLKGETDYTHALPRINVYSSYRRTISYDEIKSTLPSGYTMEDIVGIRFHMYSYSSGTTSYNGKTYYSLSNTVKPSTGDGINLTFKVLKEESDSAGGEDADYLGDNRLANRSWVSFHTIETRLDADKEGGGDKLTSATSEAVSTFYDNLPEPVMDTYKTFENGNADLQDRQGFVKKIYPGDWVDFTIRVPIDSTLYQSGGFAPYHLQLQELFGENMGNGGEQLFPALERIFNGSDTALAANGTDSAWEFTAYDASGKKLDKFQTVVNGTKINGKNALNFEICSDMHSTSHQGEPGTDSGVPIGGYVELKLKLKTYDVETLQQLYPNSDYHVYTPLGFENEFTLEKHPHGNSPSQNVHLAGGKTAGGTVVQQPQLSLLQTTVVGGSSDTTGSIRPAGTDNETATLKIKLTADYAKNMKIKLASLLPTGFTFKDVVSITKTSAKGEQTTYTPVQGTTQGNGIYMFGTEEELTVNTGDIVEITYTATAPTVEQVAGNLNSSGYASYSGACYVFADGVTNLTAGTNGNLNVDDKDYDLDNDVQERIIQNASTIYVRSSSLAASIRKEILSYGYNNYFHTGDVVKYRAYVNSSSSSNYNGGADLPLDTLVDVLPEGFIYTDVNGNAQSDPITAKVGNTTVNASVTQEGNKMYISLTDDQGQPYVLPAGSTIELQYNVKITDSAMESATGKSLQVTNYMYAFINRSEYDRIYTNVNWSSNPNYGNRGAANDTNDLDRNPDTDYYIYSSIYTYLYQDGIKPGVTKVATYNQPVLTPGVQIYYDITVSNASTAGTNIDGKNQASNMVDPTVVDVLPYGWKFISAESSSSSYDISGLSTDTVDDVTKVTIPVKGTFAPGQSVRIRLLVEADPVNYGPVTNESYLLPTENFTEKDVQNGFKVKYDGKDAINSNAEVDIGGGLGFTAEKSVTSVVNGSTSYVQSGRNYAFTEHNADVTYTLTLKNTLTNAYTYEDVCVIDRLPGVDDTGAYSQRPRGSQWSLATITNVTTNVSGAKIQYSSKASLDTPDWMGDDTGWHDTYQEGDMYIRVVAPDGYQMTGSQNSTMTITIKAKVPATAAQAAAGTTAYNSYGYRFYAYRGEEASVNVKGESNKVGLRLSANTVSGKVWNDVNKNGVQDAGELPLENVPVYLSTSSTNISGSYLKGSTVTKADGSYSFEGVAASTSGITYYVIVDPNALITDESQGIYQFSPRLQGTDATKDSNFFAKDNSSINGKSHTFGYSNPITMYEESNYSNIDAGVSLLRGTIGDKVWLDTNKDGYQQRAEPGLAGVKVELLKENGGNYEVVPGAAAVDAQGSPLTNNLTGADGTYFFHDLDLKTNYKVRFTLPSGYSFTESKPDNTTLNSTIDTISCSGTIFTGTGEAVNLGTNETAAKRTDVDAGAIIANGFHIEGRVWIDDNDDGIKNAAESYNGENGLTVSVISEDTQAEVGRTQVQADGTYMVDGLSEGNYKVKFTLPDGTPWKYTIPKTYDIYDIAASNRYSTVTPDAANGKLGEYNQTVTLNSDKPTAWLYVGLALPKVNVKGTVWNDVDIDGTMQSNDQKISGVKASLYKEDGTFINNTTTGSDGTYAFYNVPGNTNYKIIFTLPDGRIVTNHMEDVKLSTDPVSTADKNHANTTGVVPPFATGTSGDYIANLGIYTPAVVSGYVWFDTDTNGTLNDGEPRLSGYTAYLLKPSDKTAFDASQDKIAFLENLPADQHYRTNNDGSYRFEGLSPQDGYAVVVCDSDTRAYFSAPTNIVTQDDTKIAIREHLDLSLGGEKSDQNFGLYKPVQITGRAFYDADYNGIYDENTDRLLEGITVTLKGLFDNAEVATATTDENGYYQFNDVVAGQYYVEFGKTTQDGTTYDIETKVPVHTEPNAIANNVTIDGKSDGFAVTGDKDATDFNINIGFINYAHVRTLAWFDDNQNQLWDNSIDSLIGTYINVTAVLEKKVNDTWEKVNNAPVDLGQVTSIDSPYVFDRYKLMPGTYRITFYGTTTDEHFSFETNAQMDSDSFGHLQTAEAFDPDSGKIQATSFEVTVNSGETVQLNAPVVRNQQTVISKEYKAEGQTDWTADDKAEHHPGELITYRIGMQNFNTAEKQNLKVTDQINRLLEFQEGTLQLHVINNDGTDTVTPITSYTLNNGTLEITNLTIPGRAENRPDVPVQAYVEFNVKVLGQTGLTVDNNAWTVPNQATVSMDGAETVTPNTNVYVTSPIASITNTVENPKEFYQQGQEAVFKLTAIVEQGQSTSNSLENVIITDVLPKGVSFSGLTYADGTPVDTSLYTVTKDETGRDVLTLNIDILTDKEVFLVKTTVDYYSQNFDDPTVNTWEMEHKASIGWPVLVQGGTEYESAESEVQTITAKRPNVTLKKDVSKHTVKTEEVFSYTFSIYNSNGIDVADTTFTDILDKGLSVVNMPQGMTATPQEDGTTVLSMDISNLPAQADDTIPSYTFQVDVKAVDNQPEDITQWTIPNAFMLEGELDGDPNTGIDMTRANRKVDQITSNTVDVEVFRAYQVSISKTADRADKHYNVGEQVSFTVKVSNLGVEPLTNLEVADVMPNITLDAASLNNNIKQVSSQSGTAVMIQTLQPGETVTLDFLYTVQESDSDKAVTNTVTASNTHVNKEATETITIGKYVPSVIPETPSDSHPMEQNQNINNVPTGDTTYLILVPILITILAVSLVIVVTLVLRNKKYTDKS